eukprot:CAMPEP_0194484036 /NCGR_PEP_ID=MMETSP0253-20130528/5487_1 /TAXON_ID=2966 /ORGANISM="Noctiluca scintillans" /LENGTH=286 /DNA_ID=CAMNT_0039323783 /DNA_START=65 /DNA_END=925 /DNA_ORIENTATION=-
MSLAAAKVTQPVLLRQMGFKARARWASFSRRTRTSSRIIPGGKMKGVTFSDCLEKELGFCKWAVTLSDNDARRSHLSEFISFLEAQKPKRMWEETLAFGKHKGLLYDDVFSNDGLYSLWLVRYSGNPASWLQNQCLTFTDWTQERDPQFAILEPDMCLFGKHKGQTYNDIFKVDTGYCEWILQTNQKDPTATLIEHFADWLRYREPNFVDGFSMGKAAKPVKAVPRQQVQIVKHGKNKGKTFQDIFRTDRQYCAWVLKSVTQSSPLRAFADWIKQKHPEFAAQSAK